MDEIRGEDISQADYIENLEYIAECINRLQILDQEENHEEVIPCSLPDHNNEEQMEKDNQGNSSITSKEIGKTPPKADEPRVRIKRDSLVDSAKGGIYSLRPRGGHSHPHDLSQ